MENVNVDKIEEGSNLGLFEKRPMSFNFRKNSFSEIAESLNKTGLWLGRLGLQTKDTRFEEILFLNNEITEYHKNNQVEELIEKYGNLKLWYALTEAVTFIQIYTAFNVAKSHELPRAKLKKMLSGPYHSWDEELNTGDTEPRNILFELESGAILKQAGVEITGFDDVDFVYERTEFNVQCKRLHSGKMVDANVSDAISQFNRKMRGKQNLKGILCFSMDKLSGKENMVLNSKSPSDVQPSLSMVIRPFLEKHRTLWQDQPNIANVNQKLTTCENLILTTPEQG